MKNDSFTSDSTLLRLVQRRTDLLNQIKVVEAEIGTHLGVGPSPRVGKKGRPPKELPTPRKKGRKGNRGQKPGALKERVLRVLESAGEKGMTVAEIASRLGVKKANVHVWFSTTGKRLEGVEKIEPGCFSYRPSKKK